MVGTVKDGQRRATLATLVGAWLVLAVPMAAAQEVDSRWAPWVGCWRAVDEAAEAPVVCVVPLPGESAIEILSVVDGQVVSRESISADGRQHAVSRDGCEGWERAEFSADSHRVYVRSELTCDAGGARSSTGVMSMASPFEWLDVRTMDVGEGNLVWALRYRQASRADYLAAGQEELIESQVSDATALRVAASRPIAVDDVIEAAGKVSAETVQVWVAERAEPFALDASRLIDMADAGVPADVIDVVVAVSYPEKFVVNGEDPLGPRRAEAEAGAGRAGYAYGVGANPFEDPFYDPYARYGYYSPYGYGPRFGYGLGYYGRYGYGYGGFGGFGGYGVYGGSGFGYSPGFGPYPGYGYGGFGGGYGYGFGGRIVVVDRRGSGSGGGSGGSASGTRSGRVVSGGGYTSVGSGGRSTGRSAQPRSSGSSGRSFGGASRGSSGGSAAAPARSPSSSSPRSTGRRAMPRPRGGN